MMNYDSIIKTLDYKIKNITWCSAISDTLFDSVSPVFYNEIINRHVLEGIRVIQTTLRLPTEPLPNVCLGEVPVTWWDHLKKDLGFKTYKTRKLWMHQYLVYPDIDISHVPKNHDTVRLMINTEISKDITPHGY